MSEQIYTCPAPDGCNFTTDEVSELTEHINTDHAGEFSDPRWPDTPAGRASRAAEGDESDGSADE